MVKSIGVVVSLAAGVALLTAVWFVGQSVQTTQGWLRTGKYVALSQTEPLTVLEIECQNCSQSTIRNRFGAKAAKLMGSYQVEQSGTLYLRFAVGTARVKGKTLKPGCHEIALDTADRFEVAAKSVEIAFPRAVQTCSAAETS